MNKVTRAELDRARGFIEEARDIFNQAAVDAQDALAERSERWLESEKGEAATAEAEAIQTVADELDNLDFGFLEQ